MIDHVTYAPGGDLGDLVALVALGGCTAYVRSEELAEHDIARQFVSKVLPRAKELAEGRTSAGINELNQEQVRLLYKIEGEAVTETMCLLVDGEDPRKHLPDRVAKAVEDIQAGRPLRPWKSLKENEDFDVEWEFNETMLQVLNFNPARGCFEIAPHFATEEHLFSVYPETLLNKFGIAGKIARRQAILAEFDRDRVFNTTRDRVHSLQNALDNLRLHRDSITPEQFERTAVLGRVLVKPIPGVTRVSASRIDVYFGIDGADPHERQKRMNSAPLPADCLITSNGEETVGIDIPDFEPVTVPLGNTSIPVDHFTLPQGYEWDNVNRWVVNAPAVRATTA